MENNVLKIAVAELVKPSLESTRDVFTYLNLEKSFSLEEIEGAYECERPDLINCSLFPDIKWEGFYCGLR
jgi:hypothetical protein